MRKAIFMLLGTVLLFPLALPAQQESSQPSLAEAARKAREAKKTAPKAKLVFTTDDLQPQSSQAPVAPAAGEAASTSDVSGAPAKKPAAEKKDDKKAAEEAAWRKRFSDLRAKLAIAEKELDVLQRELNLNQQQYYSDPNKALKEQYTRGDINKGRADIDAKRKEVDDLKKSLADLEDELRRSGGPPAWARE